MAVLTAPLASAQVLYSQDFQTDVTSEWIVNKSTGANANDANSSADFFYNYGQLGIPLAPKSAPGSPTRGLRMDANRNFSGNEAQDTGVFSGLSVSPTGESFTGDYQVRFDAWLNSVGPFPLGGPGSTQVTSWGVGTAGTSAQWAGGAQDSIHFGATAEGGSTVDYRAYSPAAATGYTDTSGVLAAPGTNKRQDTNSYYSGLGNKAPPGAQFAVYGGSNTSAGSAGMAWRDVIVRKEGNIVTWSIDGLLIATVDASNITLGGSNILFGQYDINATTTSATGNTYLFGLIDNVVVTAVPEPASAGLLGIVALVAGRRRRKA